MHMLFTFSLDLAASDSNEDCFSQQLSTTSALHDCNDNNPIPMHFNASRLTA